MVRVVSWAAKILVDTSEAETAEVLVEVNNTSVVVANIGISLPFTCTITTFVSTEVGVEVVVVSIGANEVPVVLADT